MTVLCKAWSNGSLRLKCGQLHHCPYFNAKFLKTFSGQTFNIPKSWKVCVMVCALLREPASGVKACQQQCALACHLSPRVPRLIRGVRTISFHYCSIVLLYPGPKQRTRRLSKQIHVQIRKHVYDQVQNQTTLCTFCPLFLSFLLSTPTLHQILWLGDSFHSAVL